jgi:hypothetical protein
MALYYFDLHDMTGSFPTMRGQGLLGASMLLVRKLSQPWQTM